MRRLHYLPADKTQVARALVVTVVHCVGNLRPHDHVTSALITFKLCLLLHAVQHSYYTDVVTALKAVSLSDHEQ